MSNVDFIDFVEEKGETWFNANDILLSLGYVPQNGTTQVQCLRPNKTNRENSKLFNLQPRKFIEGKVWWNTTTLARLKEHLKQNPTTKGKLLLWENMEKVRTDSVKSVLSLESVVKEKVNNATNKESKLVTIYKNNKDFKGFIKQARSSGFNIKTTANSWKMFKYLYPEMYKEVEPHFTERTKLYLGLHNSKPKAASIKQDKEVHLDNIQFTPAEMFLVEVNAGGLRGLFGKTTTLTFDTHEELVKYLEGNVHKVSKLTKQHYPCFM